MKAAYGYVYGKNPPPYELSVGLDWLRFGTPYLAGGLRDQPMLLLRRMKLCLSIYNAAQAWKMKWTPTPEAERFWYFAHEAEMNLLHKIWNWQSEEQNVT